jgi:glycosyltransferase involved in cell wall biosynthesis
VQAASLLPVKNQNLLLETLAQVKRTLPAARLSLAGDGPQKKQLLSLAQQLNLEQNISWRGPVDHPIMPGVYQQSHLYLQTSRHESQGMSVLEAMTCGLPAIGTPVGVLRNVAARPATFSAVTLAAQSCQLLGSEAEYRAARQQAQNVVETEFSLPVTVANFLNIYQEAIEFA